MRDYLFHALLEDYMRHRNRANLRFHVLINLVSFLCLLTALSVVPAPVPVPLLGANLGATAAVAVAALWLTLDPLSPALVLASVAAWALVPGSPWGHDHGAWASVVAPLALMTLVMLLALFAHIYHHEHAHYLLRERRNVPALLFFGAIVFALCALLRRGYRPALKARLDAAERARLSPREGGTLSNWPRSVRFRPRQVAAPQTLDELADVVRTAAAEGRRVRVIASGFSYSGVCATDETLIFCELLDRVELDLSDPSRPAVWAECGATNRQVNAALREHGLQIPWNVVPETVRIAGIASMGTHGSGRDTGTLGDLVEAFEVIDGRGERRTLSAETLGAEGMDAARLGLGLFGVIARVRLRVEPAARAQEQDELLSIEETFRRLPGLIHERDAVELFWAPFAKTIWIRSFGRTESPATESRRGARFLLVNLVQTLLFTGVHALVARLAPRLMPVLLRELFSFAVRGPRVVSWTDALHFRRWVELRRCSCVAVGFKVDEGFARVRVAFEAAREIVARYGAEGRCPINMVVTMRFIGSSAALLSPAYGPGLTCFIEALSWGRPDDWAPATQDLVRQWLQIPGALPHWSKEFEHVPGVGELVRARLGERLSRFRDALDRAEVDPRGVFVNAMLATILLPERAAARPWKTPSPEREVPRAEAVSATHTAAP